MKMIGLGLKVTLVFITFIYKGGSSHRMCSVKIAVLKCFAIFTGTHLVRLYYNKVAGLHVTIFAKSYILDI